MTAPVYSFSVPNGNDIVEQLQKKHSAGTSTSHIIRTALERYYNSISDAGEQYPDCLPNWKRWKKILSDADDEQFKELKSKMRQLQRILDTTENQRNGVIVT